jgi:hypothetical protein
MTTDTETIGGSKMKTVPKMLRYRFFSLKRRRSRSGRTKERNSTQSPENRAKMRARTNASVAKRSKVFHPEEKNRTGPQLVIFKTISKRKTGNKNRHCIYITTKDISTHEWRKCRSPMNLGCFQHKHESTSRYH